LVLSINKVDFKTVGYSSELVLCEFLVLVRELPLDATAAEDFWMLLTEYRSTLVVEIVP